VKVSTSLWDIHRSKLINITIVDARLNKTCWSMVFLTMASNTYSTKEDRDGKTTWGHWCKLTFEAKCFHNWTKACKPCKNKKPNLPKIATM